MSSFYDQLGIAKSAPHFDQNVWDDLRSRFETARRTGDGESASRILEIARLVRRDQSLFRTMRELTDSGNDLSGYDVGKCFYLQLRTSPKEFLTAVLARNGLLVASNHRSTILKIQELLPKLPYDVRQQTFIVRRGEGYGFRVESERFFEEPRAEIVGPEDVEKLTTLFGNPFTWAKRIS